MPAILPIGGRLHQRPWSDIPVRFAQPPVWDERKSDCPRPSYDREAAWREWGLRSGKPLGGASTRSLRQPGAGRQAAGPDKRVPPFIGRPSWRFSGVATPGAQAWRALGYGRNPTGPLAGRIGDETRRRRLPA